MAVCWFAAIAVVYAGRERVFDACKGGKEGESDVGEAVWVDCVSKSE